MTAMPSTRLSALDPIRHLPLVLAVAPRPRPAVHPVTLAWEHHRAVAVMHPGIRGEEAIAAALRVCPDPIAQQWITALGVPVSIAEYRHMWRLWLPMLEVITARPQDIPDALRPHRH